MADDEFNEQLGYTTDDEPFVVYDVLSPEYPVALLSSLEASKGKCELQHAPGSLIIVSAGFRRPAINESYVLLGGLLGLQDVGRRFGERAVCALVHPGSSVFALYEKLGSGPSLVADTAARTGFRVSAVSKYGANRDIICIGSGELLSSLNWLEDAWPTTGSFVVVCRKPSSLLDDLERAALGDGEPYGVLADFREQMCSGTLATSERLGVCEALAYFDGPDGSNLVILTSAIQLEDVHVALSGIANQLGVALYFAGNPNRDAAFDGFEGWLSWRRMPQSWKRAS